MTRKDEHYLRDIVECAINTGMRKGEILSLKWDQVKLKEKFIYLRETKTKTPRQIPISNDLEALFNRIRMRQRFKKSEYVFTLEGKRIYGIKSSFAAALKRAGIEDFRFHDLRHTFASHFVMKTHNLIALQKILGHTTPIMTQRYSNLSSDHLRDMMNQLDGLTGGHKVGTFEN